MPRAECVRQLGMKNVWRIASWQDQVAAARSKDTGLALVHIDAPLPIEQRGGGVAERVSRRGTCLGSSHCAAAGARMILTPDPTRRVFAYPAPVDLRKGYDGLFGLVEQGLKRDPMCGDLYLFVNESRKLCKMLRLGRHGPLHLPEASDARHASRSYGATTARSCGSRSASSRCSSKARHSSHRRSRSPIGRAENPLFRIARCDL